MVRRNAETTKVRVVYDASSKEGKNGTSLNECLHVGPSLNPLLFDILIRFREYKVVLIGDIEKAFLNVEVDKDDRDSLRFLWVDDVQRDNSNIVVYRFCRVVFGVNASPFLLNGTLRHHISRYAGVDPGFARKMVEGFYVDDLVTGEYTVDRTYDLYKKARDRLAEGGFKLRKWKTNDSVLKASIDSAEQTVPAGNKLGRLDEVETYAKSTLGPLGETKSEMVLGVHWNSDADEIRFDLTAIATRAKELPATKRNTLRLLAGVFDPLGLLGPVTVCIKMLFQEACRGKIGWDDPLQSTLKRDVDAWVSDLMRCKIIRIQRCLYRDITEEVLECSLLVFADVSKKAYCAVVYLVYKTTTGTYATMVTSKTRVAPLKELSIPRLELMSARILVPLVTTVENALRSQVSIKRSRLWLDSMTALYWIVNRGEWKQFVQHRVNEILKRTKKADWSHCPGEENPADLGTRGLRASQLEDSELWWRGPQWLTAPEDQWPEQNLIEASSDSRAEERKQATAMAVHENRVSDSGLDRVVRVERYSNTGKLFRVTALVKRFCFNARHRKTERKSGALFVTEIREAEKDWIKTAQTELKEQPNYPQLLTRFALENDSDGIFRCKGRLEYADLAVEAREPIILPKTHPLTYLYIHQCHKTVQHMGVRSTLAELRSKFWIPKGRQVVKKILNQCVTCKRVQGRPYTGPPMASLPEFRVRKAVPFSKVGVDYLGPLYVRGSDNNMSKVYVALFSCCVTRAIHLELVQDQSVDTFRLCLRKFTARRGTPTLIVSDNAQTFKGTEKELRRLYAHPQVRADLDNQRMEWRFNLERAPWWGGFFERMVGSVKKNLKKVVGNARLTSDELATELAEVECTLNSRPLTYDYEEPGEEVLTPAHLMYRRRISSLPDSCYQEEEDASCAGRYRYLCRKLDHFWKRWQKEYLTDLRETQRSRKAVSGKTVQKGDVVVVDGEGTKRGSWKIAIVEELVSGKDNEVRGARVRVMTKGRPVHLYRPVQKLYLLEVRATEPIAQKKRLNKGQQKRIQPQHAAALDAAWKNREVLRQDSESDS